MQILKVHPLAVLVAAFAAAEPSQLRRVWSSRETTQVTCDEAATLQNCFLVDLSTKSETVLSVNEPTIYTADSKFSVHCTTTDSNRIDFVKFESGNDHTQVEYKEPWFLNGDYQGWINPVDYLEGPCGISKVFTVEGYVWSQSDEPCFRQRFVLTAVCPPEDDPTEPTGNTSTDPPQSAPTASVSPSSIPLVDTTSPTIRSSATQSSVGPSASPRSATGTPTATVFTSEHPSERPSGSATSVAPTIAPDMSNVSAAPTDGPDLGNITGQPSGSTIPPPSVSMQSSVPSWSGPSSVPHMLQSSVPSWSGPSSIPFTQSSVPSWSGPSSVPYSFVPSYVPSSEAPSQWPSSFIPSSIPLISDGPSRLHQDGASLFALGVAYEVPGLSALSDAELRRLQFATGDYLYQLLIDYLETDRTCNTQIQNLSVDGILEQRFDAGEPQPRFNLYLKFIVDTFWNSDVDCIRYPPLKAALAEHPEGVYNTQASSILGNVADVHWFELECGPDEFFCDPADF